jgi:hypothetical protein
MLEHLTFTAHCIGHRLGLRPFLRIEILSGILEPGCGLIDRLKYIDLLTSMPTAKLHHGHVQRHQDRNPGSSTSPVSFVAATWSWYGNMGIVLPASRHNKTLTR